MITFASPGVVDTARRAESGCSGDGGPRDGVVGHCALHMVVTVEPLRESDNRASAVSREAVQVRQGWNRLRDWLDPSSSAMASANSTRTPWWSWTWPVLALVILGVHKILNLGAPFAAVEAFALITTVFAAVYHAEVIAHRVGEPFGTLVLALAVTIIEVALIVSMMITGGSDTSGLARDTVFAAVMIVCNGIVGLCLLAGGVRHREQTFQLQGTNAALSVLITLTTLTLILLISRPLRLDRRSAQRSSCLPALFR